MKHNEILKLQDIPKNKITVRDKNGKILFEKENLVVQRGRLFSLEKLFNKPIMAADIDENSNFITNNIARHIVFFKIGSGGTINGPFTPLKPTPIEEDLITPLPFRIEDNEITGEPEYIYPSITENNKKVYYGKGFESVNFDIDLVQDNNNNIDNLISIKIAMKINEQDARDLQINELGLFIAALDNNGKVVKETAELFSKVTFATEIMDGEKVLDIVYTIYA